MTNQLKMSLGELEAEVMEIIWKQKEGTVRSILGQIQKKKKIAYTTIMTIMSRLYEKSLLRRRADASGAYRYFPRQTKEEFFARVSGDLITKMLKNYGDVAVARFVDILNSDEFKQSEEWRKKIHKIVE
ncbi:MAG: BlaI/MecI/CopY family transcriptional regulator [Patescibacteria group bacterium]